jgi:heme-degrading monooxygenase HmoA
MIARAWHGATQVQHAEAFLDHLYRTGVAAYHGAPGSLGAVALRRIVDDRAEFLFVTLWESACAVPPGARAPLPDQSRLLVESDEQPSDYEIVLQLGQL